MTNKHSMKVQVITFGARVVSISVPNRHGRVADVVLGCDDIADCEASYLGGVVGRVSGGIAGGSFKLNGTDYTISGSTNGWDKRLWTAHVELDRVIMSLRSADDEDGFPGEVEVNITYHLTNDNKLTTTYTARTLRKPTPINLSSRIFFNLAGESSGTIRSHSIAVFADFYLPVDASHVPTGDILSVRGTVNDLHREMQMGSVIDRSAESGSSGINVTYCLRGPTGSRLAARVRDIDSGRILTVFTNQPAVRLYTGDDLNLIGKNSHRYLPHSGFLLQTQNYPDAVLHSNFPDSILREGTVYRHEVVYTFTTAL